MKKSLSLFYFFVLILSCNLSQAGQAHQAEGQGAQTLSLGEILLTLSSLAKDVLGQADQKQDEQTKQTSLLNIQELVKTLADELQNLRATIGKISSWEEFKDFQKNFEDRLEQVKEGSLGSILATVTTTLKDQIQKKTTDETYKKEHGQEESFLGAFIRQLSNLFNVNQ